MFDNFTIHQVLGFQGGLAPVARCGNVAEHLRLKEPPLPVMNELASTKARASIEATAQRTTCQTIW